MVPRKRDFYWGSLARNCAQEKRNMGLSIGFLKLEHRTNATIDKLTIDSNMSNELYNNIVHNPNPSSPFKHIEVTREAIRLEFSEITPEYTFYAKLMTLSEEEKKNYPDWAIPIKVENKMFCGAGATIFLSKKKLREYFAKTNYIDSPQAKNNKK